MQQENHAVNRHKSVVVIGLVALALPAFCGDALKEGFDAPPPEARPYAWWEWISGHVDRETVVSDLKAMAEAGIGGFQLYDMGRYFPQGETEFNSERWLDCAALAASEARRLGLDFGLNHVSGWTGTGGPWISLTNAMKMTFHSVTDVSGPAAFDGELPRPVVPQTLDGRSHYRDVAVLAWPLSEVSAAAFARSQVASNAWEFAADDSVEVCGLEFSARGGNRWGGQDWCELTLYADADGRWQKTATDKVKVVAPGLDTNCVHFVNASPVRARRFRVEAAFAPQKSASSAMSLTHLTLRTVPCISRLYDQIGKSRGPGFFKSDPDVPGAAVARQYVLDLTDKFSPDRRLAWQVPAGRWRVMRFGFAATPSRNMGPASKGGEGLDCDKLSPAGVDAHFDAFVDPFIARCGGLGHLFVDSYESGCQNWTDGFEKIFRARTGYSLLPYLPAFCGQIVGGSDETTRALWDFRRVLGDLVAENYAGRLAARCRRKGVALYLEPYGDGLFDNPQLGEYADVPMGEFWAEDSRDYTTGLWRMASAAHVYGRRYVASEAFTSGKTEGGWTRTPYQLKARCDRAFANGINRIVQHCFIHNPWKGATRPGLTIGPWGTHMEPAVTWWPHVHVWYRYQARAQFLLQEGAFCADALCFGGDSAPAIGGGDRPQGYSVDMCDRKVLKRLVVRDGRIVAPGGTTYAFLFVARNAAMTPESLTEILRLAKAGARVAMAGLPVRSPSLVDYPAADGKVKDLARQIADLGVRVDGEREAFDRMGVAADFEGRGSCGTTPIFLHRRYADGTDGYFVCATNATEETFVCTFRAQGKSVELWDAETGQRTVAEARPFGDRTEVAFAFRPSGSVFVMFRPTPTEGVVAVAHPKETGTFPLSGPWNLTFPIGWYFDEATEKSVKLDELVDWTTLDDPDLKYFSGTATYRTVAGLRGLEKDERVVLDLGEVRDFAVVTVNGTTYPVLWRPPYRVDVTDAVRAAADGKLDLSVRVTNLWPNRLIGDEFLEKDDLKWKKNGQLESLPDWVKRGGRSPFGRHTFVGWHLWTRESKPLPSGLIGPARFVFSMDE